MEKHKTLHQPDDVLCYITSPWIEASKRLPTKEERQNEVIVYDLEQGVHEAYYNGKTFDYPYYGQEMSGEFKKVHAWMLMPPKP